MLKSLAKKYLQAIGYRITKIDSNPARGPLKFGRFTIETESPDLAAVYRTFPESNTVIARMVQFLVSQGPLALIDIGANCGDSLAIAKTGSSDVEVLCIEGEESLVDVLKKNARQFEGVTVKQVYLGETPGRIKVSIQKRGWNNTLAAGEGGEEIAIERLDEAVSDWSALPHLRFIKCDTEGYDIRILFGARQILQTYQPTLLFEYNREAMDAADEEGFRIFAYLEELGYDRILLYDNFGRFLLSMSLAQKDLLQDLLGYANGKARGINYYDILLFSQKDAESAAGFLEQERGVRRGP